MIHILFQIVTYFSFNYFEGFSPLGLNVRNEMFTHRLKEVHGSFSLGQYDQVKHNGRKSPIHELLYQR